MDISIILIDGGFRENFHIIECLKKQNLPADSFEILWVEFYDEISAQLYQQNNVNFIKLGFPRTTEYHSSYCFNEGIRQSKGEVLVIADADVLVTENFLQVVLDEHQRCEKLAMYFHRLNEPEEFHDKGKSYNIEHIRKVGQLTNPSNYGGCLTVRKKWLNEINGYDQDPRFKSGFHANGLDINTRLKNLGLHIMWHPTERLYHPWHPFTLASSGNYDAQHEIINNRALHLDTLPNYGINKLKDKVDKDIPSGIYLQKEKISPTKSSLIRKIFKRQ